MDDRIVSTGFRQGEDEQEQSLRPKTLREYIGQESVKRNLHISIEAALKRHEPLDHLLLYGPPGLGKTTLAGIIAAEMGQNIRITSGPAIEKAGDLASEAVEIFNQIPGQMNVDDVIDQEEDETPKAFDPDTGEIYEPSNKVIDLRKAKQA